MVASDLKYHLTINPAVAYYQDMKKRILKQAVRELGRKGGKTTSRKYGTEQMRKWGKLGGRPRKGAVKAKERK